MLSHAAQRISKVLPSHTVDIFGHDSLLLSTLPYYLLCLITLLGFTVHLTTDNPLIILFIIYSFLPLLDTIFSLDVRNPEKQETKDLLERGWQFELPLYLTIIVDWSVFFYSLNYFSSRDFTLATSFKLLGLVFLIFNLNSAQFAVAHEIMHKPGWRRALGTVHMLKTLNMHFTYEHIFGHHRKVATQEDPASADKGMNVYSFFVRSYVGAYVSVYRMERQQGKAFWQNLLVLSIVANIIFCGGIFYIYGLQCLILFLLQVLGAVFYLEVINYIEHYGLRRKKLQNGAYEKVTILHSWNSPHRFSNYLFFKLQRHSDHHENSMKPYQVLLTLDESPQLPHGYIVMTLTALFPSKFFHIMDPLVDRYNSTTQKAGMDMRAMYSRAMEQTKSFIIELSLWIGAMLVLSEVMG